VRITRSLLFVPGHRGSWVAKGVAAGADALIIDLEDSVPADLKAEARETTVASIRELAGGPTGVWIRLNSLESGMTGDDLESVAIGGVDGFVIPKLYDERDVLRVEGLVDHFERRHGVEPGRFEFILALETAQSYSACEKMVAASPRVATLFAGTARDADIARSVGFQFTTEGLESLYLRSRAVLATRSSGLSFPIVGVWQEIGDLEGMRRFAELNAQLGFRGQAVLHPSHVAIANEVYGMSDSDVAFYRGMVEAFDAAVARGSAAVMYEGHHIDYAHVKTARENLALHQQIAERAAIPAS
jgi:citrate lyase subunit beta/citryl-CoA lyase